MPGMRTAERSVRLATLLVLVSLAATLVPVEAARTTTTAPLPFPILGTSSVWTGEHIFVFGGRSNQSYQTSIIKFDPATGTANTLSAPLPTGRQSTSAVWTGQVAYIFGGAELIQFNDPQYGQIVVPNALRDILEFNPATGQVRKMPDQLPEGVWGTSAVWDAGEGAAYVFGGFAFDYGLKKFERKDWIIKYKPSADGISESRVRDLSAGASGRKLPAPTQDAGVAVVGTRAFLFGGLTTQTIEGQTSAGISDQVVTFNLATEQPQLQSARLPQPLQFAPAVPNGEDIYIFGGRLRNASASAEILRYFVNQNVASALPLPLPSVRYAMSAVTDGQRIWLVGGRDGSQNVGGLRDVVTFTPGTTEPSAPRALNARCDSSGFSLSWIPPVYDGGSPVVGYNVTRTDADGLSTLLGTTAGPPFADATARPGARYVYRVTAHNAKTTSAAGAEIEVTTCLRPPTEPRGFEAYAGNASAFLRWQAPADLGGATSVVYRVYRDGITSPVASGLGGTRFTDSGLENEREYTYRVAAFAGTFESVLTQVETVVPSDKLPGAPTDVAIEYVATKDAFKVAWTGDARATSYEVRWGADVTDLDKSLVAAGTSATIPGVVPGVRYWIDVIGLNGTHRGPPSELRVAAYLVPAGNVTGLLALPQPGSVRLQWTAPAQNGGADTLYYKIIRNHTGIAPRPVVTELDRWRNTVWVDRNVTAGATYTYRIVPYSIDDGFPLEGRGASSNAVEVPIAANVPPTPALTATRVQAAINGLIEFDASSSCDPDGLPAPCGRIKWYYIDFGDGKLDNGRNPTFDHIYEKAGTFTVSLTVEDDRGLKSVTPASVQVCIGECKTVGNNDIGTGNTTNNNQKPPPAPPGETRGGLFGLPGPHVALVGIGAVAAALLVARRRRA